MEAYQSSWEVHAERCLQGVEADMRALVEENLELCFSRFARLLDASRCGGPPAVLKDSDIRCLEGVEADVHETSGGGR